VICGRRWRGAGGNTSNFATAHQLRDLEYAKECGDTVFAPAMQDLLGRSEALAKARDYLPPEEFERPQAGDLHPVH